MDTNDPAYAAHVSTVLSIVDVIFALTVCTIVGRLSSRAYLFRRWGADDWLMVCATIVDFGILPCCHGLADKLHRLLAHPLSVTDSLDLVTRALKWDYILSGLYLAEFGFVKLSLLAFYYRFMPLGAYRYNIHALAIFTVFFTTATTLATIFQCTPISRTWDLYSWPPKCAVDDTKLQLTNSSVNIVVDVIVILLPVKIVTGLHVNWKRKLGLVILFSIGFVVLVATALRLAKISQLRHTLNKQQFLEAFVYLSDVMLWSRIEIGLAIICANVPALAAFWNKLQADRSASAAAKPSGSDFELRSPSNSNPRNSNRKTSAPGITTSASEEHIIPQGQDVVRLTRVVAEAENTQEQYQATI